MTDPILPAAKKSSWRTSLCGILAAITAAGPALQAACDGNPATVPDWSPVVPLILAAIGLWFARDNGVTSAQAGAEPPKSAL